MIFSSPSGRGCEAYAFGISVAGEGLSCIPLTSSLSPIRLRQGFGGQGGLRETYLSRWER